MNEKMIYNLNMIEKSNVNYRIMIFNLSITGKGYNINLKTLNYASRLNSSGRLRT